MQVKITEDSANTPKHQILGKKNLYDQNFLFFPFLFVL